MAGQAIRRSQFITTYGPGAILEGPSGPRVIPALEHARIFTPIILQPSSRSPSVVSPERCWAEPALCAFRPTQNWGSLIRSRSTIPFPFLPGRCVPGIMCCIRSARTRRLDEPARAVICTNTTPRPGSRCASRPSASCRSVRKDIWMMSTGQASLITGIQAASHLIWNGEAAGARYATSRLCVRGVRDI